MAHMDIFKNDAFSMGQLTGAVTKVPYRPSLLGAMGLFRKMPIRTEFFEIEEKDGTLSVIQTSQRGAPLEQNRRDRRKLRRFDTVRLAKGDRIKAAEVAGVRAFGSETELMGVQQLVAEKQAQLRDDLELTFEMHRLGALQGVLLDADGTVLYNWFDEFGISAPAAIDFNLDTPTTDIEKLIRVEVIRKMQTVSKGAWIPGTSVTALCGDVFFDKLTNHKTVRETYLNYTAAANLRAMGGVASQGPEGSFFEFSYGGVRFINYRGTDNFSDGATAGVESIGIKSDEAKFFPVGARDVFQMAMSPGEGMNDVNQPGRKVYSELELEKRANPRFADIEIYSYPLFICTRPEMLMKAEADAA